MVNLNIKKLIKKLNENFDFKDSEKIIQMIEKTFEEQKLIYEGMLCEGNLQINQLSRKLDALKENCIIINQCDVVEDALIEQKCINKKELMKQGLTYLILENDYTDNDDFFEELDFFDEVENDETSPISWEF